MLPATSAASGSTSCTKVSGAASRPPIRDARVSAGNLQSERSVAATMAFERVGPRATSTGLVERRVRHPAMAALIERARERLRDPPAPRRKAR